MSQAQISEQAPGVFLLAGVLDYLSAPALRDAGARLIKASAAEAYVVDCAAVSKSSSVGLSLLLAFMRDAQVAGKALSVRNLPKDMSEIAAVSGLFDVLSLQA